MTEEYTQINPSRSVPSLIVAGKESPITQSLAALEYLEEAYPEEPALLPKDAFQRAQVRALTNIIVSDVQPVTNSKIMKKAGELGYDGSQWARDYHAEGFAAFEAIIRKTAGEYCFGDQITMADVCLTPAMWNAERYHLDLEPYPTVRRVYENASKVSAFQKGHWKNAPGCPEHLK